LGGLGIWGFSINPSIRVLSTFSRHRHSHAFAILQYAMHACQLCSRRVTFVSRQSCPGGMGGRPLRALSSIYLRWEFSSPVSLSSRLWPGATWQRGWHKDRHYQQASPPPTARTNFTFVGKIYPASTIEVRWIAGDRPSGDVLALSYAGLVFRPVLRRLLSAH
jgi:hypothetical protein